jgi:hypothetical protein
MIRDATSSDPAGPPPTIIVVLNWAEELKAKLPSDGGRSASGR